MCLYMSRREQKIFLHNIFNQQELRYRKQKEQHIPFLPIQCYILRNASHRRKYRDTEVALMQMNRSLQLCLSPGNLNLVASCLIVSDAHSTSRGLFQKDVCQRYQIPILCQGLS
jgi:hypothetical protein